MMLKHKNLSLFFIAILLSSISLCQTLTVGQSGTGTIVTAVPFLIINGNPRSAGMGEIGVVASPIYYDADLSQNPALLARNRNTVGLQANYTPWLKGFGIRDIHLLNLGGHITFDNKHVLSYSGRIFDLGRISFSNSSGQQFNMTPQEQSHGLGYSTTIHEKFSLGVRVNYFFSNVPVSGVGDENVKSLSGDLGFLYHDQLALDSQTKWVWSTGLSIKNIGPKVSYSSLTPIEGFLPTNFELGGMLGLHNTFNGDMEFVVEGAYQLSKLMVPSAGAISNQSAWRGMISSWGDANQVGKQESQEIIHQLGLEGRIQVGPTFMAALRGGLFLEHQLSGGRRYATLGASLAALGFRVDFAYLRPFQQAHPLQNTLRLGLTFLIDDNQDDFGLIKF